MPWRQQGSGNSDAIAAIATLSNELEHCRQEHAGCLYVTRTAYRFLPEFRAAGAMDEVLKTFEKSPTQEYDRAWLSEYRDHKAQSKMVQLLNSRHIR